MYTVKYSCLTVLVELLSSRKEYACVQWNDDTYMNFTFSLYTLSKLLFRYRQSQQQGGGSDCGMYAIAYVSVLAMGEHPSSFRFNQSAMREHMHRHVGVLYCHFWLVSWILYRCLSAGEFSPFPVQRRAWEQRSRVRCSYSVKIFCTCRMLETFSKKMIQCCACKMWFHMELCVSVPVEHIVERWCCKHCLHS